MMYRWWTVGLCSLLWPSWVFAVIPVIDEATVFQTTAIAANSLKSTYNEAIQIKNQADAYIQDAKHLVALPQSYIDKVVGLYTQYNQLLQDAKGLAYTVTASKDQFEQLYSTATNAHIPMSQRALLMLQQVRQAGAAATAASAVFDRLCAQLSTAQTIIDASQAAPGTLAAQQATNQMLSIMVDQYGSLQTIQATMARVQISTVMQEAVQTEAAQQRGQEWMADWPTDPLRGPKQGQGFRLPREDTQDMRRWDMLQAIASIVVTALVIWWQRWQLDHWNAPDANNPHANNPPQP